MSYVVSAQARMWMSEKGFRAEWILVYLLSVVWIVRYDLPEVTAAHQYYFFFLQLLAAVQSRAGHLFRLVVNYGFTAHQVKVRILVLVISCTDKWVARRLVYHLRHRILLEFPCRCISLRTIHLSRVAIPCHLAPSSHDSPMPSEVMR